MNTPIQALVWDERTAPADHYPDGIHHVVAARLNESADIEARTANLDDPEQGLSEEVLASTDVLLWWGHLRHGEVSDETVARVLQHILVRGMGFLPLHSTLNSKVFMALMGTSCTISGWREEAEPERIWVLEPDHPIAEGLPADFIIDETEMYQERWDIPAPDELLFLSHWERGEVFRSGCTWTRGRGRIFYFRPGHETYHVFDNPHVARVLQNGVRWCARRA